MKSATRIIFFSFLGVLVLITALVCYGLHAMEIEDRYGNLQVAYYEAKDNDIIVNNDAKKFGKIDKTWKQINVIDHQNQKTDLYSWVYNTNDNANIQIYRPTEEIIGTEKMKFSELKEQLENRDFKFILDVKTNKLMNTVSYKTTQVSN